MRKIVIDGQELFIENGEITSGTNVGTLLSLAQAYLEAERGRFNNDEIYPDKDLAIALFLIEEMGGEEAPLTHE